jgi:hypothetical protein
MSNISKIVDSHKGDDELSSLGDVVSEISSSLNKAKDQGKEKDNSGSLLNSLKIPTLSKKNHDLLSALKPFMSKKRQEIIEGILKLEQVTEIAKLVR